MADPENILQAVRKALLSEPRAKIASHPLTLIWDDGDLIIEGEVGDVAAKKLVLERAAATSEIRGIVDRLRVSAAQPMKDDELREAVCHALQEEISLSTHALYAVDKGKTVAIRVPPAIDGKITVSVAEGVVTLDGDVIGLGQKRMAGVLAWWVPGTRDVINGLGVTPPETDSDEEITDAIRLVLEKDPFVNAEQIRVSTRGSVVTLQGLVPKPSEREAAEFDAWYVFGVDKVVNAIEVRA